jgi:hypothetical protein
VEPPIPGYFSDTAPTVQHQEYAVALVFIEFEPGTEDALRTLCADAFGKHE